MLLLFIFYQISYNSPIQDQLFGAKPLGTWLSYLIFSPTWQRCYFYIWHSWLLNTKSTFASFSTQGSICLKIRSGQVQSWSVPLLRMYKYCTLDHKNLVKQIQSIAFNDSYIWRTGYIHVCFQAVLCACPLQSALWLINTETCKSTHVHTLSYNKVQSIIYLLHDFENH